MKDSIRSYIQIQMELSNELNISIDPNEVFEMTQKGMRKEDIRKAFEKKIE